MKRIVLLMFGVVTLVVGALAQAGDFKVAVVRADVLLNKSPQYEAASKRLESEFSARHKELDAQQKIIHGMETKLNRDSATMSEAELRKIERDVMSRKRDWKNAQDEFNDDLSIRRNEELGKLQRIVVEVIAAFAKQEKYDMILDNALYASEQVDITEKVLQKLKAEQSGAGSAK